MHKEVISRWKEATEQVADAFVEKYFPEQGRDDAWWVGDEVGSVFYIADMFFDVDRMLEAIKLDATFEQLDEYYDKEIENHEINFEDDTNKPMRVNFKNFVKYGFDPNQSVSALTGTDIT